MRLTVREGVTDADMIGMTSKRELVIPPSLYFQFGRFTAGLPQQYFAFDPDRYLARVPQRSGAAIAAIAAVKFVTGFAVIWLAYAVVRYIRRGAR